MGRPAILMRFPRLRLRLRRAPSPVIPPDQARRYPTLAADIRVLDEEVGPSFAASERAALVAQNRYRRQQVIILLGSALLAGLGGLQAVFPAQRWLGLVLVVLGILLAGVSQAAGELKTLDRFLTERIKAERLRATYFRYLSRTGRYRGDDRVSVLRRAVIAVESGEEPT
jgi:Protein of unknown function (DUF4231)